MHKKVKFSNVNLVFEELEPRLLLSADGLAVITETSVATTQELVLGDNETNTLFVQNHTEQSSFVVQAKQHSSELVIIDSRVPNFQQLHSDIIRAQQQGRDINVVILDVHRDGLEQISEALSKYNKLDAVHIVSHGKDAQLQLGATQLNKQNLQQRSDEINKWQQVFTDGGDLLLYGCNLAANEQGKQFVDELAQLTGTDIAASDDTTGHQLLGGDWDFEYNVGDVETQVVFSDNMQQQWQGTLANNAPVLDLDADDSSGSTGFDFQTTFIEGDGALNITDSDVSLIDIDNANLASIVVILTNEKEPGNKESLSANVGATSLTAVWDSVADTLTISGVGTVADYLAVLSTVSYDNTANNPDTTDRIITFVANDGTDSSVIATTTVSVMLNQDVPVANDDGFTVDEGSTNTLDLAANDTDLNGDIDLSSISIKNGPSNGTITAINPDGTVVYVHDGSETLSDSFEYTITDLTGAVSNKATVTLTINPVNDAPLATTNTVITAEDTPYTFSATDFTYTDDESDALVSATITNPSLAGGTLTHSGGTVVNNGDTLTAAQLDTLVYTPVANDSGAPLATFDFTVNDADSGIVSAQMEIAVTPVNDAPLATANTVTTIEDTPYSFNVADFSYSDIESDALTSVTFTNLSLAGGSLTYFGGTVSNGDTLSTVQLGSLVYTPATDANGSPLATFDFTVNDDDLGTISAQMAINVTAVNDVPVALTDSFTVFENATTILDLAANDIDLDDGLDLTSIVIVSSPVNGSIVVNNDGTVDYVHDGTETVSDSFSYSIKDLTAVVSNTVTVNLSITPVNDPAIATDDPGDYNTNFTALNPLSYWRLGETSGSTITDEGASGVDGTYFGATLDQPGAIDGDSNTAVSFDGIDDYLQIDHDNAFLLDDGTIQFWFNTDDLSSTQGLFSKDANGADTGGHFTIKLRSDGSIDVKLESTSGNNSLSSASGLVTSGSWQHVAVTFGANGMELFLNGVSVDTNAYTGGLGATSGDIGNFEPIVIGASSANSDTGLATPLKDFFTGSIDEVAIFDQALTVQQIQDIYNSAVQNYTIAEDTTLVVPASEGILINDIDEEGNPLTAVLVSGPTNAASFTLNADGSFSYTPLAGFNGVDTFTYTANDGNSDSNVATVTITIFGDNSAPVNTIPGTQFIAEDTQTAIATISVADSDAGTAIITTQLTVSNGVLDITLAGAATISAGSNGSNSLTISGNVTDINATLASLLYTGNSNVNGVAADMLTMVTNDLGNTGTGGALSDTDTIQIDITAVNDAPVANNDAVTVNEGASIIIDVSANDTDIDNALDLNSIVIVGAPANGTLIVNGDGTIEYLHDGTPAPADSFSYVISDISGAISNVATVNITVNLAPTTTGIANVTVAEDSTATNINLNAAFDDADNLDSELSYTITGNTSIGLFNSTAINAATGELVLDYAADMNGFSQISIRATDPLGTFVDTLFSVTVTPVNDAPVLLANTGLAVAGTNNTVISNANLNVDDIDNTNTEILYTVTTLPANGELLINGVVAVLNSNFTEDDLVNNRLSYQSGGSAISDQFAFTVSDGAGGTISANTFNIAVLIAPPEEVITVVEPEPLPEPVVTVEPVDAEITLQAEVPAETVSEREDWYVGSDNTAPPQAGLTLDPALQTAPEQLVPEDFNAFDESIQINEVAKNDLSTARTVADLQVKSIKVLWQAIDQMNQQIDENVTEDITELEFRAAAVSSSGVALTAGVVAWVLRGGALMTSLITTIPVWKAYDPLPILAYRNHEDEEENITEDKIPTSLEEVRKIKAMKEKMKKHNKVDDLFSGPGDVE